MQMSPYGSMDLIAICGKIGAVLVKTQPVV